MLSSGLGRCWADCFFHSRVSGQVASHYIPHRALFQPQCLCCCCFLVLIRFPSQVCAAQNACGLCWGQSDDQPRDVLIVCPLRLPATVCALSPHLTPIFWPLHSAGGILVPQPGIEPVSPVMEGQCLNHWTTREVPALSFPNHRSGGLSWMGVTVWRSFFVFFHFSFPPQQPGSQGNWWQKSNLG